MYNNLSNTAAERKRPPNEHSFSCLLSVKWLGFTAKEKINLTPHAGCFLTVPLQRESRNSYSLDCKITLSKAL